MFRAAKLLYLVAVVGLLVALALIDQFAPVLHARSLRHRLQVESTALHSLLLQRQEAARQRGMDIEGSALGDVAVSLGAQLILFDRDGHIRSSSIRGRRPPEVVESIIARVVEEPPVPPSSAPPELVFDESGSLLRALLAGWLPGETPADTPSTGFVLLIDGGELPPNLAAYVIDNLSSLRESQRLWLTVVLGVALLVVGVVLFEFEGRRYRRAVDLLEYQLASRSRPRGGDAREPAVTIESAAVVVPSTDSDADNGQIETELRALWNAYRDEQRRHGESSDDLTFEEFRQQLTRVEAQVKAQHDCRSVRFSTAYVDGTVVVLAAPAS